MLEKRSLIRIDICKLCFKPIEQLSFHRLMFPNISLCHHCFKQTIPKFHHFNILGIDALAIYDYDEVIKSRLYQFKGCFDYELRNTFLEYFYYYLKLHYLGYTLVPAPSSKTQDDKRGFNHVIEMFKILNLSMSCCIHKSKDFKQSDLPLNERKNIDKYLFIDNVNLHNKKVLIVDDVLTSGSTIKAMIKLIKQKNPKKIKVLVLSKAIEKL